MTHVIKYAARTDRGLLRANNQDSVFAGDRLLVIADGMGGHAAGDVASRLVVAAFVDLDELPLGSDMVRPLTVATREGNAAIAEMVDENPELDGMGTTLTALLFDGPVVALAHVGDSRAYLYRNGVLHQISHDDTFVQSLVDDGRITADEAAQHPQRSLLLRALNGTEMDPTITLREISPGDRFLICSDGLSDVVSPESIADTLAGVDTDQVADTLIQLALVGGGPDNVTVIVADVLETGGTSALGAAGGSLDPEATGPMQPIHLTQRMPRVPLPPIPEDVPAKPEYAQHEEGPDQQDYDEDDEDEEFGSVADADADADTAGPQSDRQLVSAPPAGGWRRRWAFAIALVVLIGVGITGAVFWTNSKFYVGDDGLQVAVFKGVNGSLLGWHFASVQENSCGSGGSGCNPLLLTDLVQAARDQVNAGIPVSNLADARAVITRLTQQQLPLCPAADPGTHALTASATGSAAVLPPTTSPTATTALRTARETSSAQPTPQAIAPRTLATPTPGSTPRPPTQSVTTIIIKPVVPVTTTVTITIDLQETTASGQRLRSDPLLRLGSAATMTPAAGGPITRAEPNGTPTVTVFTTITLSPTAASSTIRPGTPLVSPAAQPGVTCRLAP